MSTVHSLAAYAGGAVSGMQACQRDWSPYVVHFTSFSAMAEVKRIVLSGATPKSIYNALNDADKKSFDVLKMIAKTKKLVANSPNHKENIPNCVCFSECNLPGLISHAERYGRFGIVFEKADIYSRGGRPCCYVDSDCYGVIDKLFSKSTDPIEKKIFGLSNVYRPAGEGKIQDYTHEREWRVFEDVPIESDDIIILCPEDYLGMVNGIFEAHTIIPIDILQRWGA
jgi:hypothetical protein